MTTETAIEDLDGDDDELGERNESREDDKKAAKDMKPAALTCSARTRAYRTPPERDAGDPIELELHQNNFLATARKGDNHGVDLTIAIDTEYKTPDDPATRQKILDGEAVYQVLSYQSAAAGPGGQEWDCIYIPQRADERITFGEFLAMTLAEGIRRYPAMKLPTHIYVIGHFTRADMTAFADFHTGVKKFLSNLRGTFVSLDTSLPIDIEFDADHRVRLNIMLRDTYTLASQNARSLVELGRLVGVPKETLDDDPSQHRFFIENMDITRRERWDRFRKYAMQDPLVCLRYAQRIRKKYAELTGSNKMPVTLTAIGVELFLQSLKSRKLSHLQVLGKEEIKRRKWNPRLGRVMEVVEEVWMEVPSWHIDFVTECYHGGCNQQFWFGPGFESDWVDFDLSSAYPSTMAMIGMPLWNDLFESKNPADFQPNVLGFANVTFKFPSDVRFPCLPVRTANGLIYPKAGRSYCCAAEIDLALRLGASIQINRGIIVPTDDSVRPFGEFIRDCIAERNAAGAKTLEGLTWKEISNSTYGKTAQGLRRKRVYDMRSDSVEDLPPSQITNPYFAAFITGFVRALLLEIVNALPKTVCVFSATTDGFLSDADGEMIERAQEGTLATLFQQARQEITGKKQKALEAKHRIRQPLGWRTRGQATLKPGAPVPGDDAKTILLAKGGIYTERHLQEIGDRNDHICKLFFGRTPTQEIVVEGHVGLREMLQYEADFVDKVFSRRLSMEYDWKRRPIGAAWSDEWNHVFFDTEPWDTIHQFDELRAQWPDFKVARGKLKGKDVYVTPCIKTVEDYSEFADYLEMVTSVRKEDASYLKKRNGALRRLRKQLCTAWRNSHAGFRWDAEGITRAEFANQLMTCGIPCSRFDVDNDVRVAFKPGSCPSTALVHECLGKMKIFYPTLNIDEFVTKDISMLRISLAKGLNGPFMCRVK